MNTWLDYIDSLYSIVFALIHSLFFKTGKITSFQNLINAVKFPKGPMHPEESMDARVTFHFFYLCFAKHKTYVLNALKRKIR